MNCGQPGVPVEEEDSNREFSLSQLGGLPEVRAVVAREHPSPVPLDSRERFLKALLRAFPQEDREGAAVHQKRETCSFSFLARAVPILSTSASLSAGASCMSSIDLYPAV